MQFRVCSALSDDHEAALFFQLEGPTKHRIKREDKGHILIGTTKNGEIAVLVFPQDQREQCCTHARLADISAVAQEKKDRNVNKHCASARQTRQRRPRRALKRARATMWLCSITVVLQQISILTEGPVKPGSRKRRNTCVFSLAVPPCVHA